MIQEDVVEIWQFPESEKDTAVAALLSGYTGIPAPEIEITAELFVKPVLENDGVPADFHFNISHSGGAGLLAVSDRPVGVDIEKNRKVNDFESVSRLSCTDEELRILSALDGEEQNRVFFELWTRKEACVKALGADILPSAAQFQCAAEDPDGTGGWNYLDMFWQDGTGFFLRKLFNRNGFTAVCCTPKKEADIRLLPYEGYTV